MIFRHFSKQKVISCSSTESEYKAVVMASIEVLWLRSLLTEIGVSLRNPPVIFCDNLSTIYLAYNPIYYAYMKYVEFDYH